MVPERAWAGAKAGWRGEAVLGPKQPKHGALLGLETAQHPGETESGRFCWGCLLLVQNSSSYPAAMW